ncbi:sugar ABC transporter substrate-binding protein, partial [Agrobacterium tumefaciens]|nr:sugar ABC transporter substrate-binding protein [Agrobacterium tumefaciens]NTE38571.1 sugar ABC transporter substrate-binding protein [Agrobacterium tumefaciens]NTF00906.1 sugar ABC transporter substrate-binding protein [Agrobacterium tumefaciens]
MINALKLSLATTICVSAILAGSSSYAETMKLGLSMPTLNTPFFTVLINAATEQAKSGGGNVVQTTNANRDASQQVTDFRNLINAGANVILAGVVDRAAIKPALDYAKSKNVPVVIVDDKPAAGDVYAVVRADNLRMGASAAEALAAAMPNKK